MRRNVGTAVNLVISSRIAKPVLAPTFVDNGEDRPRLRELNRTNVYHPLLPRPVKDADRDLMPTSLGHMHREPDLHPLVGTHHPLLLQQEPFRLRILFQKTRLFKRPLLPLLPKAPPLGTFPMSRQLKRSLAQTRL